MEFQHIGAHLEKVMMPPPPRINILLLAADGQTYDVCVHSLGTVQEIIDFLQQNHAIHPSWVTLIFGYNILRAQDKLCSLGVYDGSAMQLVIRKNNAECYTIQKNITERYTILVSLPMVPIPGNSRLCEFVGKYRPKDLVYHVKKSILDEYTLPVELQELQYNEQTLHNGRRLSYYLSQRSDSETFRLRMTYTGPPISSTEFADVHVPMQVMVKTLTGKTIVIDITRRAFVEDLKQKICDKEGIPTSQQRVCFGGKQLEDGRKVSEYNITGGSMVHLLLRLYGGNFS